MQAAPSQKQQIPEQIGHGSLKGEKIAKGKGKERKNKKPFQLPSSAMSIPVAKAQKWVGTSKMQIYSAHFSGVL